MRIAAGIAGSCDSWPAARSCKAGRSCGKLRAETAAARILNTAERIYTGERVADRVAIPAGYPIRYGTAGSSAAQPRSGCGYEQETLRC